MRDLAEVISKKESEKEIKSGLSIMVAMELISHLIEGDSSFNECYKALCLFSHHSKKINLQEQKYSGIFYPPLDVVLTSYFFNENPQCKYVKISSRQVLELTDKLTKDFDVQNIKLYSKQIENVKVQLSLEKNEIKPATKTF